MEYIPLYKGKQYVPGIYIIESICGKQYVGSAIVLRGRFMAHRCSLFKSSHDNIRLQNYFNKHGYKSLLFKVIEYCDKDLLIEREQFWIDKLNPFFNIARIAGATYGLKPWLGKKHSEETKAKIKQSNLDTFSNRPVKEKAVKLTKAENILRLSRINKSPEARQRLSDLKKGNKYWLGRKHKKETIEARKGAGNGRSRKVYCIELDKTFDYCLQAANFFGVGNPAIINSIKRKSKIKSLYTLNYVE